MSTPISSSSATPSADPRFGLRVGGPNLNVTLRSPVSGRLLKDAFCRGVHTIVTSPRTIRLPYARINVFNPASVRPKSPVLRPHRTLKSTVTTGNAKWQSTYTKVNPNIDPARITIDPATGNRTVSFVKHSSQIGPDGAPRFSVKTTLVIDSIGKQVIGKTCQKVQPTMSLLKRNDFYQYGLSDASTTKTRLSNGNYHMTHRLTNTLMPEITGTNDMSATLAERYMAGDVYGNSHTYTREIKGRTGKRRPLASAFKPTWSNQDTRADMQAAFEELAPKLDKKRPFINDPRNTLPTSRIKIQDRSNPDPIHPGWRTQAPNMDMPATGWPHN
jgi:hypothetical protein